MDPFYISFREDRFLSWRLLAKSEAQPGFYPTITGIKPSELEALYIKDIQNMWIYKPTSIRLCVVVFN